MEHRCNKVHWQDRPALSWRIGFGISSFLVAEGSGWSRPMGRALFADLKKRKTIYPKRRPIR